MLKNWCKNIDPDAAGGIAMIVTVIVALFVGVVWMDGWDGAIALATILGICLVVCGVVCAVGYGVFRLVQKCQEENEDKQDETD